MQVADAMHYGAIWVEADTPVVQVSKLMQTKNVGAILIGKDDRLVGIVTDRDIACRAVASGKEWCNARARDVMTRRVIYCLDTDELTAAAKLMQRKKLRRLAVLTEKKRLVGVLGLGDLARSAAPELVVEVISAVTAHHRRQPNTADQAQIKL